jgi:hypothetical protein
MTKRRNILVLAGAVALGLSAVAVAAQAPSDTPRPQKGGGTPAGWSYDIKDGKRVPKAQRKVNPDGSWSEETRSGNCTETRTGKNGEVRTTRACD